MKKGQGLSLNTIIIAAIVLIVLVVLWAIFTGRMGAFTTGLKKEEAESIAKAKELGKEAGGAAVLPPCPTTEKVNVICKCGTVEDAETCDPDIESKDNCAPTTGKCS